MQKNNKLFKLQLTLGIILVVFCVSMFLTLMIKYMVSGSFSIDANLIEFSKSIRSAGLTNFFKVLTHLGSMITLAILCVIIAIVCKPILVKIFAIVNIGFVGAFCLVVKYIVKRPRPEFVALIEETGYSFPSAHSMGSMVVLGFVIFLIWKYLKNKPLKITLTSILSCLIVVVGYTRVYLGVHYITDVLAGFLAGGAYLVVAIFAFNIIEKKINSKKG